MVGHFAVGSYFSDISLPENAVFKSSLEAMFGRGFEATEAMEKIFHGNNRYFQQAVKKANSLDPVRIRVNGWGPYNSPAGDITVNNNNQLTSIPRIAQVINVGGFLKYRLVFGDTGESTPIAPIAGEGISQEEACYFGPIIDIPTSFDLLRIISIVLTIVCILLFCASAIWVFYYRNMVVIRYSGSYFLLFSLAGCMVNVTYIFILVPVEKNSTMCVIEFWPLHAGFVMVFAALLQKVYTIFKSTQRKRFLKSQGDPRVNFWKQTLFVCGLFLIYMIVRSFFQGDMAEMFVDEIEPGVLVRHTWDCKINIWEWAILGVELIMVVMGIILALQIRDVPTAFDESFQLGMAIYLWAFVKILSEIFLVFLPFNYQTTFALKAFGELIPSLHTGTTFLWPQFMAIYSGKGNELPAMKNSTVRGSSEAASTRKDTESFRPSTVKAAEVDTETPSPQTEAAPFLGRPSVSTEPGEARPDSVRLPDTRPIDTRRGRANSVARRI
ncbi:7 transmembrane sweet-taste receptor of 3 GCPR-domain-containing protein [Chytridium lagenaria]|nr:7 transmembrane sweet-taste receptor of 3 GCPR-domain-containing protein [Chytridium lagenaria]